MFCYQCQEAAGCKGCTVKGVCGKTEDLAKAQDLLIYILKGISVYSVKGREVGVINSEADKFITEGLFATITNANFDRNVFIARIRKGLQLREELKQQVIKAGGNVGQSNANENWLNKMLSFVGFKREEEVNLPDAAIWFANNVEEFNAKAETVGVLSTKDEDIRSLRELII